MPGQVPGQVPAAGGSLPFAFAGRMIDGKEVTLFLSKDNRQFLAKVNDVIEGAYRVDKIDNMNAVLTYLPTNTQQTLIFNSTAIGSSALREAIAERAMVAAPASAVPVAQAAAPGPETTLSAEKLTRR